MFELIEVVTRKTVGIFLTVDAALTWADAHGGRDAFRVLPW